MAETILVKCPHCGEEMQAPTGRDSIICMFCGKEIHMEEKSANTRDVENVIADPGKCFAAMNDALEHTTDAFDGYLVYVREFGRRSYQDLFDQYRTNNTAYFSAIRNAAQYAPADMIDGVYTKLATPVVRLVKDDIDRAKKLHRTSMQVDYNLFMVQYYLPALKALNNALVNQYAEVVCKQWADTFKDSNIQPADFDEINGGFKTRLCYITTAVCNSLEKGEDCEELQLIRGFRDGYLKNSPGGSELIEEYYDIAPTMVNRINKLPNARDIYEQLFSEYISPCVEQIHAGALETCKETYCRMVEALKKTYFITKEDK